MLRYSQRLFAFPSKTSLCVSLLAGCAVLHGCALSESGTGGMDDPRTGGGSPASSSDAEAGATSRSDAAIPVRAPGTHAEAPRADSGEDHSPTASVCPTGLGDAGTGGCAVLGASLHRAIDQAHYFVDFPGAGGVDLTGATITATVIAPNAKGGELHLAVQHATTFASDALVAVPLRSLGNWTQVTLAIPSGRGPGEIRLGIYLVAGASPPFEEPATVAYVARVDLTMADGRPAPVGPYAFPDAGSVSECISDGAPCSIAYTERLWLDYTAYDTNVAASLTWLPQ